ncbi:MAG: hypothetical protein OZ913_02505 [Ignavibacteriaceae bacterium]|nr:MAG: hypothetical protein EDM69_05400 [Chlorobiota bacterium]KXK06077.1 MAG: hypothetical protein UZ04_CHB001000074 [Chlorobi bacterium OLB4]MBV6398509.1 hypothetical protein [Ignavibacteria bacterium]MCC6885744.1 hypothetical protein [Ignavibacteriales bacterium]MCE7953061.1 hypothetical protein [Chlorobi bacterium CHB7]MDL1887101.1 hypothetical protein [Ignavibacteria bacterium CHB1]MEB2329156.1 hypothetical protein [Ignavibacteriaceae bacterium]OQY77994.1 MAG: hypothetical protein B6D4
MIKKYKYIFLYQVYFLICGAVFVYMTYAMVSLLRSHNESVYILAKFESIKSYYTIAIPVSSLVLLVLSNIILKKYNIGKYFFLSLIFYIGFVLVEYMFVNEQYLWFRRSVELNYGGFSVNPVIAVIFIFAGSNLVLINYFIARRIFSSTGGLSNVRESSAQSTNK